MRHWYTNGISNVMTFKAPSNEWIPGRSNVNRWFNNGISEKQFAYPPDSSWVVGRMPISDATKQKHKTAHNVPHRKVCRICDRKEMKIRSFNSWLNSQKVQDT